MHRVKDIPKGTLETLTIESKALENNMLGDPVVRDLPVYLPPNYEAGQNYPLIVEFAGYTSSGLGNVGWKNFTENLPERLDRLIHEGSIPPVIAAFPDSFTRLGGNQFINSSVMGSWADHITQEILPLVETTYTCGGSGKRLCFGKSSGGYGALVHGMLYPDVWSHVACHSGDMGFDIAEIPLFPQVCATLAQHDYDLKAFMDHIETAKKHSSPDIHTLMILCFAASYDPDPGAFLGLRLPLDPETAELIPERWANWMKWDPVEMVDSYTDNLKKLKGLFIDCGEFDQYHLHYGARRLKRKLETLKIPHVYEEFPDNHSGLDYRYDVSLSSLLSNI